MAKATVRTATPAKQAVKPTTATARAVTTTSSGATKAQQAAQHQGRAEPPQEAPRAAIHAASVPATVAPSQPVAEYGSSSSLPEFMRDDAGMGKENISRADMETPRIKLIQGLSKELETYNDLRPGHFFHTAAEFIFDESFVAVPIYMDRRFLLWRPLENGGGILARADDGIHWSPSSGEFKVKLDRKDGGAEVTWRLKPTVEQSGLANWGTMNPADTNSPPAATLMYTFVLAFPEQPDLMPAVLTFQRSSIKIGRRFNTKLKTVRTPLFGTKFRFSAFDDHNGAGQEFKNINVTGEGLVEDEGLYRQYRDMHLSFKDAGLSIRDIEGLQGEEAAVSDEPQNPEEGKAHDNY